jgi:hypothetical protein
MLAGRTPGGKLVNIVPPDAALARDRVGKIVPVRLIEAGTFSFIGKFAQ